MALPSIVEMKSKTEEEKKWLTKYFYFAGGCFQKPLTEAEYRAAVSAKVRSLNLKQKALSKLGIDESEVNEVQPVVFEGFDYGPKTHTLNSTTSTYSVAWLFFSATQIYFYCYTFDMTSTDAKTRTEEYFYKDVTAFSSGSDSKEVSIMVSGGCALKPTITSKKGQVESSYFAITVPGEKLTIPMQVNSEGERIVQGLKQKLREKKA